MASSALPSRKNCIFFTSTPEKSAKIKNRRSSGNNQFNRTSPDDRRFASWRTTITDIQSGNIGGLSGIYRSLPNLPGSPLDSFPFSSPTLWGVFPREHDFFVRELWAGPPTYFVLFDLVRGLKQSGDW
jgi:hypothetical protein